MPARCSESAGPYSFAAATAVLPPEVKAAAQRGLADWRGCGLSALELPFTGAEFGRMRDEAEADLRGLLGLPADYRVLFLQGGALAQFTLLPLNLLRDGGCAAYVESGYWSGRAIAAARAVAPVEIAASRRPGIPPPGSWRIPPGAAYCHITTNETADGVQFHEIPVPGAAPLVADATGDLLSRRLPVERFGLLYASAQKSLGAAGLTLVIVRQDLLGGPRPTLPAPFDYALQARERSRVNTPPAAAIHVAGLMLKWLKREGGLAEAAARNRRRAERLYDAIEASRFYRCTVPAAERSAGNVCFRLPDIALEAEFLAAAERRGLLHLKGHPAVGGIRASLYNATTEAAVTALIGLMDEFAARHRGRD